MVQERYVGFKTAKLLKEKGFDGSCTRYYQYHNEDINGNGAALMFASDLKNFCYVTEHLLNKYFDNVNNTVILAPTQAVVMQWLREHNIDIIPFHEIFDGDVYWCRIEKKYGNLLHTELQQDPVYKTYEEAVEEAIKYSLENLV